MEGDWEGGEQKAVPGDEGGWRRAGECDRQTETERKTEEKKTKREREKERRGGRGTKRSTRGNCWLGGGWRGRGGGEGTEERGMEGKQKNNGVRQDRTKGISQKAKEKHQNERS